MKPLAKKLIGLARIILGFARNIWVTRVYLVLLILSITYCLYQYRERLDVRPEIIRVETMVLALLLHYITYQFQVYIYYLSYRELGANISFWQTFQVLSISRLGVYMPGKVWFAANYYLFSRGIGIDRETIGRNFIVNIALFFLTGALVSLLVMTELNAVTRKFFIMLPVLMLVLIHRRILNGIFSFIMSLLPRSSDSQAEKIQNREVFNWSYSTYLWFIMLYFILWIFSGATLFMCINSFGTIGLSDAPLVLAAGAVSIVLSVLAVFAPGGVGVRESVGVVIMSQIVPVKTAIFAFVLFRLCQVIIDLLVGIIGAAGFMQIKKQDMGNERS